MLRTRAFVTLVVLVAGCGAAPTRTPEASAPENASPRSTRATSPRSTRSTSPRSTGSTGAAPRIEGGAVETGLASYYADSLKGRPTASGEPYDPGELTAAHRTLPFGTVVEVSRDDGRTVTVRINDRGPFGKKKRIIDLSRRAAEALGMVRAGVVSVRVRVVGGGGGRAR